MLEMKRGSPRERQVIAVKEFVPKKGTDAISLIDQALAYVMHKSPGRWDRMIWVGDPTINNHSGARLESFASRVWAERRIRIYAAKTNYIAPRLNAVRTLLDDWIDEETPRFVIVRDECPVLIKGFEGRYCYRKLRPGEYENSQIPLKNRFADVQDALQYGALEVDEHIYGKKSRRGRNSA